MTKDFKATKVPWAPLETKEKLDSEDQRALMDPLDQRSVPALPIAKCFALAI